MAIVARSLGLPSVVGAVGLTQQVKDGDWVILDGRHGLVIVNPDPATLKEYERFREDYGLFQKSLEEQCGLPAVTLDGHRITLAANLETPQELDEALRLGAEGVGLYRTEFLYLNREDIPGEEEQYRAYKELAVKVGRHPAIIRTLDLGGDKVLSHLNFSQERNPFLGLRAIRMCLKHPEIFKPQLRAILRAAAHGPLKIMFPMISNVGEIRQAKALLAECAEELRREGLPFQAGIETGAMIEIPSAALMADILIQETDFLSLGTNDLIQYTMAVDRVNEGVAYLYEPLNPSVLRLIRSTVKACHRKGKRVGMCGEMAGDPHFVPLLLGMGLDELSVSLSVIPQVKKVIRGMSYETSKEIYQEVFQVATAGEALNLIHDKVSEELKSFIF